ncbi:MAG: septal ring lytic transglycosylase RlpA family protein [Cyanobacteria bacterium P01_G01_bin.54]
MSVQKRAWVISWTTLALVSVSSSLELSEPLDLALQPEPAQASDRPWRALKPVGQDSSLAVGLYLAKAANPESPDLSEVQVAWSDDKTRNTCPAYAQGWERTVRDTLPQNLPDTEVGDNLSVRLQMAQLVSETFRQSVDSAAPQVEVTDHAHAPLLDNQSSELWHVWQQLYTTVAETLTPNDEQFYLWVNGELILKRPELAWVDAFATSLRTALDTPELDPAQILPTQLKGQPAIRVGDRIVLQLNDDIQLNDQENPDLLVIEWVNKLREALGAKPLELVEAQEAMYRLAATEEAFDGLASWYGPYFHGRLTANGEIYDQEAFTAAHKSLPFNTYLKVTNLDNNVSVILRINDRGPYIPPRTLDLSRGVARCIKGTDTGVIPYEAVIMTAS